MENAPKNNATREQRSCPRMVMAASYLLLVIGLSLPVGCATAVKAKLESADSRIDTSLVRLAKFVPARYDKPEYLSKRVASLESNEFEIERPTLPVAPDVQVEAPAADPSSAATVGQGEDAAHAAERSEHGTSGKE